MALTKHQQDEAWEKAMNDWPLSPEEHDYLFRPGGRLDQWKADVQKREHQEWLNRKKPVNIRPRDTQKSKVYRAERVLPDGKCFKTIPEIEEYINRLISGVWFKKHFPWVKTVEIRPGFGARRGFGGALVGMNGRYGVFMTLPKFARKESYILHELAHGLQEPGSAAHGREFCQCYLKLIKHYMGKEAYQKLRCSFIEHKVKYKPKRTLSPEQRAKAIARLKAYQKGGN